jgi:pteridine reductase
MKTALITGSAKRIGREIALHLAKQNYRIIIHHHTSKDEALALHDEIPNSQIVFGNLQHSDAARFILDQVDGKVDILINNAAIFENDSLDNFTYDRFLKSMMINLYAPMALTMEMQKRYKSGVIINLLDLWAADHPNNFLSYCTSKNSLKEFTLQGAKQLKNNFRMNGILIGAALYKEDYPKEFFDNLQKKFPSSVEGICQAVDYILSDNQINGELVKCK